jgi:hypothetical protein
MLGLGLGLLIAVPAFKQITHLPPFSGRTDHTAAFNARSTAVTVFASAPRPTRTVTPSISTSKASAFAGQRLPGRVKRGSGIMVLV